MTFSSEIENFKRKLEIFKRSSEIFFFQDSGPLGVGGGDIVVWSLRRSQFPI